MIRGWIPAAASMAAYIVTLVMSLTVLGRGLDDATWRIVVSLSPMLPAVALCWSIVRVIRGLDEMQRKLQLEAFGLAFAGTAVITFSYGFLENVGFPKLSMFAVWPLMAGLWGLGLVVGRVRYR